jgi:hypothetical protein
MAFWILDFGFWISKHLRFWILDFGLPRRGAGGTAVGNSYLVCIVVGLAELAQ